MAADAKNSQAIVEALTEAEYKLRDARLALKVALEHAELDYEGNAEVLKNLAPTANVLLSAVSSARYTWSMYNNTRKREEAAKARYFARGDDND